MLEAGFVVYSPEAKQKLLEQKQQELAQLEAEVRDLKQGFAAVEERARAELQELRVLVTKVGHRTLREDGMQKVAAGLTTFEEVIRVSTS